MVELLRFSALLTFFYICDGLKILSLFPLISKSHNILGDGINRHLLNAGHEVTYVTPFLKNNTHPNLRQIDVTSNFNRIPEDRLQMSSLQSSTSLNHEFMIMAMHLTTRSTIQNENVQKLLNDPNEYFDLVIVDWMYDEIIYSGIAKIYDAPLVWFSTLEPHWAITRYIDEALHPAYSSDLLSANVPPFTFWQRAVELWTQLRVSFYKETIIHFFDSREYNSFIVPILKARGKEPPSPQELRYNASMVIGNSHVSFGEAHRLPVNYIPVGGFHIDDDVTPLQGDLKKIFDNAKRGVIYFSMGSLIKSKDLPEDVRNGFIAMFGKLKQTVMWKFEEELFDLPSNVHVVKWAPQQSILAHPNCVLFITHGGILSTTEAIHFSVPIIGIPVFADQFNNIDKAVSKGFAKKIDLKSPSVVDDLKAAIDDVLGDPKYKQKVEELSFIFHHRPIKPGSEIVHWVEHVVKTRGAPHWRSPALMVPWYQKMFLDLLALIALLVVAVRSLFKKVKEILFKRKVKMN